MDNRFLDMTSYLKQARRSRGGGAPAPYPSMAGRPPLAKAASGRWSRTFAAADRVLVILIENGGVDLGIPAVVDRLLALVPGASAIPDSARAALISGIGDALRKVTDNLFESAELLGNRYAASKPGLFGDVIILRDGTSSYDDLKRTLLAQSRGGKIVDLIVLTHGGDDAISVPGGIDGQRIRNMRAELGSALAIRAVYMMNCVGASLNQAWLDAGARASAGTIRNNYLPEPTTFFFWKSWKEGKPFEEAVTSAYRKTVNLMNETVRGLLRQIPLVGTTLAEAVHFEEMDFVRDSAPVVQGVRTVTISSDDLSTMQSVSNRLATTVLPLSVLHSRAMEAAAAAAPGPSAAVGGAPAPAPPTAPAACRQISPAGLDFMKQWEGLRVKLCNDAEGQCAIGYGTVLHPGGCDGREVERPYASGITPDVATQLLTAKCGEVAEFITQRLTAPLNQNESDALISVVYSIGADAFGKSTLLKVLNAGDKAAAAAEIRKWTQASKDGAVADVPELVKRREAEASLFARAPETAAQGLSLRAVRVSRRRLAAQMSAVNYTVPGVVPAMKQPTPKTCWATVMAVMTGWRTGTSTDIRNVLAGIGSTWVQMFDQDRALTSALAPSLYADAGLVTLESFNPSIEAWEGLLRQFGPLYVDVGYNVGATTHAIIVTAISGDGTLTGTSITYLDPIPGLMVTDRFDAFLAKYESTSAVQWPYTVVHWPAGVSVQSSTTIRHSYRYVNPSRLVRSASNYAVQQNPAPLIIAGIEVADALQIGLGAISVAQTAGAATSGTFVLTYPLAQRLLTSEARVKMPGAQTAKQAYSRHLFYIGIGAINAAEADVIVEWEGNPYGEISTPIIRNNLSTSSDWSRSAANITIVKRDVIPLPNTDPRAWPIVYSYVGSYDPYGNGLFEFHGEFELNAFGGLKFNSHEVVSRSAADFAIGGTPYDKVQHGADNIVATPQIPQEQVEYLKTRLP